MSDGGEQDPVEWLPGRGSVGSRIGRRGSRIVVDWPGIGRLSSSGAGEDAEFTAVAGADAAVLKKFRATSLLACYRYLSGSLSLHASAVGFPFGGVVLVGDSGAGKSTTAMALVEHHGGRFLADDIVPIDWDGPAPLVSPVDDSFWLTADASAWFGAPTDSREKSARAPRTRAVAPERLRAIVELVFDEQLREPDLREVRGRDVFSVLSSAHVCYATGGDEEALRNFAVRARLAEATRVFQLRRPRTFETLMRSTLLLKEHLSGQVAVDACRAGERK